MRYAEKIDFCGLQDTPQPSGYDAWLQSKESLSLPWGDYFSK